MKRPPSKQLEKIWKHHHEQWRDPLAVCSDWESASETDTRLFEYEVTGEWWNILEEQGATLLVTREYEHLALAMTSVRGKPALSFFRFPHPSGLVVDRSLQTVHVASTRNPNQIYRLSPMVGSDKGKGSVLTPRDSLFLPGSLYLHDLAFIDGRLHANAVGQNAVVELKGQGATRVWWPKCVETKKGPVFDPNYLQLNSIAAGSDLESSYFSASTDVLSKVRPGNPRFAVDKKGVIFSGRTREAQVRGLTRPHSARLHEGQLWVDNSGYGEVGVCVGGKFEPVARLQGWTRGLSFIGPYAFVGISRILPRFEQYAPGLNASRCVCGIQILETRTGRVLGGVQWPWGNQIFAIDWISNRVATGFPFQLRRAPKKETKFFYSFRMPKEGPNNEL